jgi:hypothetical protein
LFSSGLLSKWGFSDGDAPDTWLDWCEEHGIDYTALRPWRDGILPALVRRYLVPALDRKVALADISTSHNPIRARTVNGADVEDCWYDSRDTGPAFTPEYVEIPFSEVLKVAREACAG